VSHVEQELLSISEYLSSPSICCRVHVSRSLVFCLMFCKPLFLILSFFFGHCIVCPSSYGFWLSLWYHQTLLGRDQIYFVLFLFCFVLCLVPIVFYFSLPVFWLPLCLSFQSSLMLIQQQFVIFIIAKRNNF
jgi:hypothetical protein